MQLKLKITLLSLFCSFYFFSQNVILTFNDDSQIDYHVDEIEKISFDNNLMLIHLIDSTIISWDLSIMQNFTHSESGLGVLLNSPLILDTEISLYPNPTDENIQVIYSVFIPSKIRILIYDQNGKLCLEHSFSHIVPERKMFDLQLNSFESGTYNCIIESSTQRISKLFTIR